MQKKNSTQKVLGKEFSAIVYSGHKWGWVSKKSPCSRDKES